MRRLPLIFVSSLSLRCFVNAELRAVVPAVIELGDVALKVLLADVVERSDETALQKAETAFDGVRRHVAACIFFGAVVDGFVTRKAFGDYRIGGGSRRCGSSPSARCARARSGRAY